MTDIQQLLEQLTNPDTKIQTKALNTLPSMGSSAIDPLISLLSTTADWNYRMVAYQGILNFLASTRDPRIIPAFIGELRHTESYVYDIAKNAFTAMGESVVEPMLAVLNNPDDKANYAVINLAGVVKNPRFIPPLLNKLQDPAPMIRSRAAKALAELREQSAVLIFQQMVLAASDRDERRELLQALDKFGQRAWVIEFARRILLTDGYTNQDRQSMVQFVSSLNDPATADLLMQVLKKQEFGVTTFAFDALGKLKYVPAVDYLIELLTNSNPNLRGLAAFALGEIGDKRAVKPLKALARDKAMAWEFHPTAGATQTINQVVRVALAKLEPSPGWKFW